MCGIAGIINAREATGPHKHCEFLLSATIMNMLRGIDSTGMFQIGNKAASHRALMHKAPQPALWFVGSKQAKTLYNGADRAFATVVHNRAATHGDISADNCHPFAHGRKTDKLIVGVHNGSLYNWKQDSKYGYFDVDSDYLYAKIAAEGAEDALSSINGAYALVWWDHARKSIRVAANNDRPLAIAGVKGQNTALLMSEHGMLFAAASRHGIELDSMVRPETGYIYDYPVDGDVRSPTKVKIPPKVYSTGNSRSPLVETEDMTPWGTEMTRTTSAGGKADGVAEEATKDEARVPIFFEKDGVKVVDKRSSVLCNEELKDMGVEFGIEGQFWPYSEGTPGSEYAIQPSELAGVFVSNGPKQECLDGVMLNLSNIEQHNLRSSEAILCKVVGKRSWIPDKAQMVEIVICKPLVVELAQFDDDEELSTLDTKTLVDTTPDDKKEEPTFPGPRGTFITEARFQELTKYGCCNCSCDLELSDAELGTIKWMQGDEPCCLRCYQQVLASRASG